MKNKKIFISIVALILALSMLAGCGNQSDVSQPSSGDPQSSSGGSAGKNTLTVAIPVDIATLYQWDTDDTWALNILNNIVDPLWRVDPIDGTLYGWIAEEWEISEDGKQIDVKIHDNVKFSNGEQLTSKDVKWTLEEAKNQPWCARWVNGFIGVDIVDDYNFVMDFEYGDPNVLKNFSTFTMNIMPAEFGGLTVEQYKENPIGSGPFVLESWTRGDRIVFNANKEYFRGAPSYEQLIVRIMPDNNSALMALEAGEVDIVHDLKPTFKGTVQANDNLRWQETVSTMHIFIQFNNQKPPFNDIRVREALNMAINRDQVQAVALDGGGRLAPYGISPYAPQWNDNDPLPKYDPEGAKKLLAEAGYPNGLEVTLTCRPGDYQKPASEVVQANWEAIGVKTTVDVMEKNAQLNDLIAGNYEAGWQQVTDLLVDGSMWGMTHDSNYWGGKGNNRSFYKNERYDELNALQRAELDVNQRNSYFEEMKEIYWEDTPNAPGFFAPITIAINKDLQNSYAALANLYRYEWFSWE